MIVTSRRIDFGYFFKVLQTLIAVTNVRYKFILEIMLSGYRRARWSCVELGRRLKALFLPCWVTGCAAGRSWSLQRERGLWFIHSELGYDRGHGPQIYKWGPSDSEEITAEVTRGHFLPLCRLPLPLVLTVSFPDPFSLCPPSIPLIIELQYILPLHRLPSFLAIICRRCSCFNQAKVGQTEFSKLSVNRGDLAWKKDWI